MAAVPESDLPDSLRGKAVPESDLPAGRPTAETGTGWERFARGVSEFTTRGSIPFAITRGLIEEGRAGGAKAFAREREQVMEPAREIYEGFTYDPSKAKLSEPKEYAKAAGKSALLAEVPAIGLGAVIGGLTGGYPGAARGAVTAGLATPPIAATGGLLGQAARDIGLGPSYQTLAEAMPLPGQKAIVSMAEKAVSPMERVLKHYGERVLARFGATTPSAEKIVEPKPIESILGGRAPSREAEARVGEAMQRGATEAQAAARTRTAAEEQAIQQRAQEQLAAEKERVARLRGRATGAQLMQEQSNAQRAAQASGLSATSPTELGAEIQGRLVGRQAAIDTEMKTAYQGALNDFLEFARGEQRAGRFWQNSEAGQSAISKLEAMLTAPAEMGKVRPVTLEQEAAIKKVLADLRGTREIKVTEPYPETRQVSEPVDVMVVDDVIRKLGEAYKGRPAQGYEAIGEGLAKKMRDVLRTSMEDYASSYGAAKSSYRKGYELLDKFQEGPVAKVTETSAKVRDRLRLDPQGAAEMLFKSPQSVSDFTAALGDKSLVTDLGRQFVNNKLSSLEGSVTKTENWLKNPKTQETLEALGLKGYGDDYLNKLKTFDTEAKRFGGRAEALEKQVTPEGIQAGRKEISTAKERALADVRKQASDYEKRVADAANLGKAPAVRLEQLLNTGDPASIRRVGQMLDSQGRAAMPDAIRQYISRSSPGKLADNWDKTKRLIESGKLMTPAQLKTLDDDIGKALSTMGKTPTPKQVHQIGVLIASRLATFGAATKTSE